MYTVGYFVFFTDHFELCCPHGGWIPTFCWVLLVCAVCKIAHHLLSPRCALMTEFDLSIHCSSFSF